MGVISGPKNVCEFQGKNDEFLHLPKKTQHSFPKRGRGGGWVGQRPFGSFPKIHPFWGTQASLTSYSSPHLNHWPGEQLKILFAQPFPFQAPAQPSYWQQLAHGQVFVCDFVLVFTCICICLFRFVFVFNLYLFMNRPPDSPHPSHLPSNLPLWQPLTCLLLEHSVGKCLKKVSQKSVPKKCLKKCQKKCPKEVPKEVSKNLSGRLSLAFCWNPKLEEEKVSKNHFDSLSLAFCWSTKL